jgi:hypothetical protein
LKSRKAKVNGHERKNEMESKEEPWAGQGTILTIEFRNWDGTWFQNCVQNKELETGNRIQVSKLGLN